MPIARIKVVIRFKRPQNVSFAGCSDALRDPGKQHRPTRVPERGLEADVPVITPLRPVVRRTIVVVPDRSDALDILHAIL